MTRFFESLDALAGLSTEKGSAVHWLERAAFFFLILMVVSAPHSIAATQTSWLLGMAAWLTGAIIRRRTGKVDRSQPWSGNAKWRPLGLALWALFLWAAVSSIFSYEPAISLLKLRGLSTFLIFYFVIYNVRRMQAAYFVAFALICSCMVNVVWMPVQRIIGRGVEVHGIAPESPLTKALITEGDTLLEANGKKLGTPDDLVAQLEQNETVNLKAYRPDFDFVVNVNRADMLEGNDANKVLGIESWKKSHNFRSKGFYGHYTTYAEVLQLIASLVFGLLVATIGRRRKDVDGLFRLSWSPLLIICLAGMCLALLLTVTRASQLAFMISAFAILVFGASRKWVFAAVVLALPIVFGGLIFLQQSRQVGFFDVADESTRYRLTMWRDGTRLWTADAHNFVFGMGMDSIKVHWQEWGMYEGGRLPMGHFHSTPIQLLTERGLPALLLWLTILGIYTRTLWRGIKREKEKRINGEGDPWAFGILLGCLGGTIGFFASGWVHYNLGDQEVAMIFYLLMGLGVRVTELSKKGDPLSSDEARSEIRDAA